MHSMRQKSTLRPFEEPFTPFLDRWITPPTISPAHPQFIHRSIHNRPKNKIAETSMGTTFSARSLYQIGRGAARKEQPFAVKDIYLTALESLRYNENSVLAEVS